MEAMREVALAHYDALPDEGKKKIHDEFKIVEEGGVSEYVKSLSNPNSEKVYGVLKIQEGFKEEESLDFNEFVTLNYILSNTTSFERCEGCSSLLMGRGFFSCEECFFNYPEKSYDLCSHCYGSKKFLDHKHGSFCDNQTMKDLSRRKFAQLKREAEKRNTGIQQAMIDFYSAFTEFSRSVAPDLLEVHFGPVSYGEDKDGTSPRDAKKAYKISRPENDSTEIFGIITTPPTSPGSSTTVGVFPRLDLIGAKPSLQP